MNRSKRKKSVSPAVPSYLTILRRIVVLCVVLCLCFLLIYMNMNFAFVDDGGKYFRGGGSPLLADKKEVNPAQLNYLDYKREDDCDFSLFVKHFQPKQLEINCANIHLLKRQKRLGSGYWRKVYQAKWKGKKVAMKIVRRRLMKRPDIVSRHVKEAALLFQLRHDPNIVHLVGWCNTTLVVEYVPKKLEDLVFDKHKKFPVKRALRFALDAAKGLDQLHSVKFGPVAHTDIQTRQMLIDKNDTLLLNDFNRMKYTGILDQNKKCIFETPVAKGKWRAPEEYSKKGLDEKLDIFSMSYVLWSLRSREPPFMELTRAEVYDQVVTKDLRPNIKLMADYPKEMQALIIECWDKDPAKRPSAKEMVHRITKILKKYI